MDMNREPPDQELEQQHELERQQQKALHIEKHTPDVQQQLAQALTNLPELGHIINKLPDDQQQQLKDHIVKAAFRGCGTRVPTIDAIIISKQDGSLCMQANEFFISTFSLPEPLQQQALALRQQMDAGENPFQSLTRTPKPEPLQPASNVLENTYPEPPNVHEPSRLAHIHQQLAPLMQDALSGYPPEQQHQLTQHIVHEISQFAGIDPRLDQISRLDNGELYIQYNRGSVFTFHPQEIVGRSLEQPPVAVEQSAEETRLAQAREQLQQQVELQQLLSQHPPFEQLAITHRLSEAALAAQADIEQISLDENGYLHLELSHGLLLTTAPEQLLQVDSGRELLNHAEADPTNPARTEEELALEALIKAQLQAELAAEDSLGLDIDTIETRGFSLQRTSSGRVLIPTGNGRAREALNLAADPLGLIEPLIGVHSALNHLDALNAERQIERLRQQMNRAGIKNLPPGYQMSLDAQGNSYRDYGRTLEDLTNRYLEHAEESRMKATWGERWRDLRIGKSGMTPVQFEERVMKIQQEAADRAYERGLGLIARGKLLIKLNMHENVALGNYVDKQVRRDMRNFARSEGLSESGQSTLFAVNRYLKEVEAPFRGQPDIRIGRNLYSDTTLALKHGGTEQIMRWQQIRAGNYMIIRPSALGGSYVIPPSSIKIPKVVNPAGRL